MNHDTPTAAPSARQLPPEWDAKRLRHAIEAEGVALWSWNVDTDELELDDQATNLWGLPSGQTVTFKDLSIHIHPADQDRVRTAFSGTCSIVGPYDIDFRIVLGSEVRWISAQPRPLG